MRNVIITEHTTGETPQYEVEDAETEQVIYDRCDFHGQTLGQVRKFVQDKGYKVVGVALS